MMKNMELSSLELKNSLIKLKENLKKSTNNLKNSQEIVKVAQSSPVFDTDIIRIMEVKENEGEDHENFQLSKIGHSDFLNNISKILESK